MLDDKKLYALLGERIKRLRRMQSPEMNQEKLGQVLGLTRTSITNIERGKQKLTVDALYKLCETFSVDVAALMPTLADVVVLPAKQVVVGGQSFEVPAKTADYMNTLRPPVGTSANKSRKQVSNAK